MYTGGNRLGVSPLVSAVLIIIIAVAGTIIFFTALNGMVEGGGGQVESAQHVLGTGLKVEAYRLGPGYVLVYARGIGGTVVVNTVYIMDEQGNIIGTYNLDPPVRIGENDVKAISVPLFVIPGLQDYNGTIKIKLASTEAAAAVSVSINLGKARSDPSLELGLLAGRTPGCRRGDLRVDANFIHWTYVNLASGEYKLRYISGSTVSESEGYVKVFTEKNGIDLSSPEYSSRLDRYALGPAVVFVNPYRAAQEYTVWVTSIGGSNATYRLEPLTSDPEDVVVDAVVFWEDLWWPGTTASLDNYIDHVVRVTVFFNNTARIEILHASGCYLHFFMYNPNQGLPDFDSVPTIVGYYIDHGYRTLPEHSVIYVKSHGAYVPPLGTNDIWDPVNGVWISNWPPIFTSG